MIGSESRSNITLCKNDRCPIKKDCYRFQCKPKDKEKRTYVVFTPYHRVGTNIVGCDTFLPLRKSDYRPSNEGDQYYGKVQNT